MVRMQIEFTEEQAVDRLLVENGDTTSEEALAAALAIMGKFESDRSDAGFDLIGSRG